MHIPADYLPRQAGSKRSADRDVIIYISGDKRRKIKDLASTIADRKRQEIKYRHDWYRTTDRWTTGLMGEAALEELLKIPIIEWEAGASKKYRHADIQQYQVGVKTVLNGKRHVIEKINFYPQILCTVLDDHHVRIDGLATTEMLNKCQDDSYILDPRLRARGAKTCYDGYDRLIRITSRYDLEQTLRYIM